MHQTLPKAIGSRLLAEIGKLVKQTLGPDHMAFRYGGDEFVALLRNLDKSSATQAVAYLQDHMRETDLLTSEGMALRITASFGLATFPQDGDDLHGIIRAADSMMYCAKAEGRDRLVVASEERPQTLPPLRTSRHA